MRTIATVTIALLKPDTIGRRSYRFVKNQVKAILRRVWSFGSQKAIYKPIDAPTASEVEAYYDKETDVYLNTYGAIIQSARPASDTDLLNYFSASMGLRNGMHILDAGCGVCGPAVGLAKRNAVTIEAITISDVQVLKSRQYVAENQLADSINVTKADYTNLAELYPASTFDLVFFLETLGYANNLRAVLTGVVQVLKPGGSVYIKDFFLVPVLDGDKKKIQWEYTNRIRKEYLYRIPDLTQLIATLRDLGLYLEFIRPMSITEDFTKAALFETVNTTHTIYTKTIHTPFQLFESLELKFRKVYPH